MTSYLSQRLMPIYRMAGNRETGPINQTSFYRGGVLTTETGLTPGSLNACLSYFA